MDHGKIFSDVFGAICFIVLVIYMLVMLAGAFGG